MAILKNAGLDTAHLVTDMDINQPMPDEGDHMCPACAAAHSIDTPCGEAVEEEYANSPDEEYQDDSYMLQDLSGGLNRKKDKGALRAKDPAITYEQKLKAQLKKNLYEKYEKLDEFGLDDLQSGWNKAKDTVSGWFNGGDDNQQAQTTQKKTAAKPATKKKQRSHADAMKDMNDRAVANLEKQIQKAKNASPDQKFKINQNGQILELTPEQYQNYHEQQRDFIKAGNHVSDIGPSKYGEFMNKSLKIGAEKPADDSAEQSVAKGTDNADKTSIAQTSTEPAAAGEEPPAEGPPAEEPAASQQAYDPTAEYTPDIAPTPAEEPPAGQANPQAGPPPTPPKGQEPTAEPATQPDISQTQPTGAEKSGGATKPATNDQANYFQQQRAGGATKPATKPAAKPAANPAAQQANFAQGGGGAAPQAKGGAATKIDPKIQAVSKKIVNYLQGQGVDPKTFFANLV